MCRAETVLQADRCKFRSFYPVEFAEVNHDMPTVANVDWALLNFMQDWFPVESQLKLKQNESEAQQEELKELGLDGNKCIIC